MGSWFSNMHIRKTGDLSQKQVLESIVGILKKEGFEILESGENADYGLAVLSSEQSGWFSVYSDLFAFEDPGEFTQWGESCGKALNTDILGISCVDSDYLYLNLRNPNAGVDSWVSTGNDKEFGVRRRSRVVEWKKRVDNYQVFREKVLREYVCAEELLYQVADCLKLPGIYSNLGYSELEESGLQAQAAYLFFRLPEPASKEPPTLQMQSYSLMPCVMGMPEVVECINTGGKSRGLSVFFVGDYVEQDEIIFTDVMWQMDKNGDWEFTPVTLEKVQLADGQWAFVCHDPQFVIPPRVNPELSYKKQSDESFKRAIRVRFTPQGNARKRLDITVVFVPDENPAGQTGWRVWGHHRTKREFLEEHNKTWEKTAPELIIREDSVDGL